MVRVIVYHECKLINQTNKSDNELENNFSNYHVLNLPNNIAWMLNSVNTDKTTPAQQKRRFIIEKMHSFCVLMVVK